MFRGNPESPLLQLSFEDAGDLRVQTLRKFQVNLSLKFSGRAPGEFKMQGVVAHEGFILRGAAFSPMHPNVRYRAGSRSYHWGDVPDLAFGAFSWFQPQNE